ncbi:hypothetical protein GCM10027443_01880 [Pontibacter brevis]
MPEFIYYSYINLVLLKKRPRLNHYRDELANFHEQQERKGQFRWKTLFSGAGGIADLRGTSVSHKTGTE